MVCMIQNERERTSIETHLEHYSMIMIKREREREREIMAEQCDLVYHNNMHSVNTLMSFSICVFLCVCCVLCIAYICFFFIFSTDQ